MSTMPLFLCDTITQEDYHAWQAREERLHAVLVQHPLNTSFLAYLLAYFRAQPPLDDWHEGFDTLQVRPFLHESGQPCAELTMELTVACGEWNTTDTHTLTVRLPEWTKALIAQPAE